MLIRFYGSNRPVSEAKEGDALQKGENQSIKGTTSTHHRLWHLIFIITLIWSHLGDIVCEDGTPVLNVVALPSYALGSYKFE